MKPTLTPVKFKNHDFTIEKDGFPPMPAMIAMTPDNWPHIVTCWRPSFLQLLRIIATRRIWLMVAGHETAATEGETISRKMCMSESLVTCKPPYEITNEPRPIAPAPPFPAWEDGSPFAGAPAEKKGD